MIESARLVDLIIALTLVEAIALTALNRWRRRGIPPDVLLTHLAAGLCLLLALRLAISGAEWWWLALALAGAGLAHLADLFRLWARLGSHQRAL